MKLMPVSGADRSHAVVDLPRQPPQPARNRALLTVAALLMIRSPRRRSPAHRRAAPSSIIRHCTKCA
jgi:hypothetical protein